MKGVVLARERDGVAAASADPDDEQAPTSCSAPL